MHVAGWEAAGEGHEADPAVVAACLPCCRSGAEDYAACAVGAAADAWDQADLLACAGWGRNAREVVREESHGRAEDHNSYRSLAREGHEGLGEGIRTREQPQADQGSHAGRLGLGIADAGVVLRKSA